IGMLLAKPAAAADYACPVPMLPIAPAAEAGKTTRITSDQAELTHDRAVATGHVRLEKQNEALESPHLRYDRESGRVHTSSGAQYLTPGLYVAADTADYGLETRTGEFSGVEYTLTENGGRGKAKHVKANGKNHYI